MALVRKLAPGGPVNNDALNNELNTQLASFNLGKKDEQNVRTHLVQLRDYFANPQGKSFSADPLSQKYTISGPGSETFTGSPDEIHRNWLTGKLNIKNDQDAMSVAAAIYNKALQNTKGSNEQQNTSIDTDPISIGDLSTYIQDKVYGTNGNYQKDFQSIQSNPERQTKILQFAKDKLQDYINTAEQNKGANYSDLNQAKKTLTAINSGWDSFKSEAEKLKWEPDSLLVQPDQQAAFTANQQQQDIKTLTSLLHPSVGADKINALIQNGYNLDTNHKFGSGIDEYIQQHKGIILKNKINNSFLVIDPDGQGLNYINNNPFSSNYGESWAQTQDGFIHYTPDETATKNPYYVSNKNSFVTQYDTGDFGRELQTNLPDKVYGWSHGDTTLDKLGRRDFSKELEVENKNTGQIEHYFKMSDGTYKSSDGKILSNIQIKGFGPDVRTINYFVDPANDSNATYSQAAAASGYNKVQPIQTYSDLNSAANDMNAVHLLFNPSYNKNTYPTTESFSNFGQNVLETMQKLAAFYKHIYNTSSDNTIRMNSVAQLRKLSEYINQENANNPKNLVSLFNNNLSPWKPEDNEKPNETYSIPSPEGFAKGGKIRIAQSGIKIQNYMEKYLAPSYTSANKPTTSQPVNSGSVVSQPVSAPKNIIGTIGDMSDGQKALGASELALDAASFVPGYVGLGAALASGTIDTIREFNDPNATTLGKIGTIGENLAFAALSFFGAGFLKSFVKGAKYAKDLEAASDVAKETKILPFTSSVKAASELSRTESGIKDSMNFLQNVAPQIAEDTGKSVKKLTINDFLNAAKATPEDTPEELAQKALLGEHTSKVSGFATTVANSPKLLKGIKINSNIVNTGLRTVGGAMLIGTGVQSIPTAFNAAKQLATFDSDGNWNGKNLTMDDLRSIANVAFAARLGKFHTQELIANHYGFERTNPVAQHLSADFIPTNGNPVNIKVTDPKLIKTYAESDPNFLNKVSNKIFNKEKATKALTETKNAFITEYNKLLKDNEPKLSLENWDTFGNPQINVVEANKGTKQLSSDFNPSKNVMLQTLGKKYAQKYANLVKKKSGGILKLQSGNILQTTNFDYTRPAKNNSLPYTPFNSSLNITGKVQNGQYSPSFDWYRDHFIDQNWYNENIKPLSEFIKQQGGSYIPKNAQEVQNLTRDKKFGPVTAYISNKLDQPLKMPNLAITGINPTDVKSPSINFPNAINNSPSSTNSGVGNLNISNRQGILPNLLKSISGSVDPTDLANIGMFANTWATNIKVGNAQRKAVADSMYHLPYMNQTYLRIDKPYELAGQKQAANVTDMGNRIANSTSDLNKGIGARFAGTAQANTINDKAQMADQQRIDQLQGQQLNSNAKVDAYNLQTLGKNRGLDASAFKGIQLINANQDLAQNTAVSNLIRSIASNIPVKAYNANQKVLYKAYSNPALQSLSDEYTKLNTQEGIKPYYDEYQTWIHNGGDANAIPWESSVPYKNYQAKLSQIKDSLTMMYKPIQALQLAQQFNQPLMYQNPYGGYPGYPGMYPQMGYEGYPQQGGYQTPYLADGGTLIQQERLDLDENKMLSDRVTKEKELEYKAIMFNNEMLQKALIRVFK